MDEEQTSVTSYNSVWRSRLSSRLNTADFTQLNSPWETNIFSMHKTPEFYETGRSLAVFTKGRYWNLSWVRQTQLAATLPNWYVYYSTTVLHTAPNSLKSCSFSKTILACNLFLCFAYWTPGPSCHSRACPNHGKEQKYGANRFPCFLSFFPYFLILIATYFP